MPGTGRNLVVAVIMVIQSLWGRCFIYIFTYQEYSYILCLEVYISRSTVARYLVYLMLEIYVSTGTIRDIILFLMRT